MAQAPRWRRRSDGTMNLIDANDQASVLMSFDSTNGWALGEDDTGYDFKLFGATASAYMLWDESADDLILAGSASFQTAQSGTGYSFNLISVTSSTDSGNTRGWRVNTTTSDSISHGDLQCVHGYLTLGSSVTLTAGAAVYPLSAWIDIPSDLTTATGNVIAGCRVIFDANGVDLSALAGGGESALFYGQTWSAASSAIEHGLRIIAGASTTIKNGISIGGTGTYTQLIDLTDFSATYTFMNCGLADATTSSHRKIFFGDASTRAGVRSDTGDAVGLGSVYFGEGEAYIKQAHAGAATDWEVFSHAASDAG